MTAPCRDSFTGGRLACPERRRAPRTPPRMQSWADRLFVVVLVGMLAGFAALLTYARVHG